MELPFCATQLLMTNLIRLQKVKLYITFQIIESSENH